MYSNARQIQAMGNKKETEKSQDKKGQKEAQRQLKLQRQQKRNWV